MIQARKVWLFLSAALLVSITSCSGFFTNSLASGLARDQDDLVPAVTSDNLDELMDQAEGNTDMAAALLDNIEEAMADATPEERVKLRAAAVKLASTASGVGVAVLQDAGTILDTVQNGDLDDPAVQSDLIADVTKTLGGLSNLSSTSTTLLTVLPPADDPDALDAFAASSTADDMTMAAIVLLAAQAEASSSGSAEYIDRFDSSSPTLTDSEKLAVELASRAAAKNEAEGGSGTLADLLEALNLTESAS